MARPTQGKIPSVVLLGVLSCVLAARAETVLVRDGRAECAIVTGSGIEDLYRHTAEEIKRYVAALSGASPAIVSPAEVVRLPQQQALILVGGRAANPMVREAVSEKLASFEGLKKGDYIPKSQFPSVNA